jgi:hypothetical protein
MAGKRRTAANPAARRELLTTFIAAARTGEMAPLERFLAADVTTRSAPTVRHEALFWWRALGAAGG